MLLLDRRVSIELSRIPLLWMNPIRRGSENVRQQIRGSLQIAIQDARFDRYFSRISTIYNLHENEFCHEENFEQPLTICLDCNMSVDEVAFGLALQSMTPFRFSCNRLLMRRLPELQLPAFNLIRLLDPLSITQFELEDPELGSGSRGGLPSALGWLGSLRNLRACSLPACIPPPLNSSTLSTSSVPPNANSIAAANNPSQVACRLLNRSLISLRHIQRLSLARCYLQGQLQLLLGGLSQPLEYLNLQDCCLNADDIEFLAFNWRPLSGLYELNISRNNLARVPESTLAHLFWNTCFSHSGHLTCLSLAYTCLPFERLVWILRLLAREIKSSDVSKRTTPTNIQDYPISSDESDIELLSSRCTLRVLCIQNFIPPTHEISRGLLHLAITLPRLRLLQLYPAFYAFPGMLQMFRTAFSSNLRRQIIATALCTGAAYRVYSTWNTSFINRTQKNVLPFVLPVIACSHPRRFPLMANSFETENDSSIDDPNENEHHWRRVAKLDFLQNWIEEQIPLTFTRGLLDTINILDSNTILEFERLGAPSLLLRSSAQANFAFALLRTYFFLISASRRIEVLNIIIDGKNWAVETHLRLVLLPSPSREDRTLPPHKLRKVLESKARWIEFRVIFHLNKKGDISLVKITRINQRDSHEWSLSRTQMRRYVPVAQGFAIPLITLDSSKPDDIDLQLDHILSHLEVLFKKGSPVDIDLYSSLKKWENYVCNVLYEASKRNNRQISSNAKTRTSDHQVVIPLLTAFPCISGFFSFSQSVA
ncbi:unnamed protein product [Rodentolepis nana]|uniref:Uncharacterized protein n=1 Tax=Rodentolepis nana TaxID=102285 RepID=A0A3P7SK04_RODNA|nr:unnamed protein product [Rodentolepis nana]